MSIRHFFRVFIFILAFIGLSAAKANAGLIFNKAFDAEQHEAPLYKINLDEEAEIRWNAVAKDYKNQTREAIRQFIGTVPKELMILADLVGKEVDYFLPSEFGKEIRGIARSANTTVGDITLLNIIYDLTAFCTGIVANDNSGGLWHGRNLDYGDSLGQTRILENLTIRVDFYKGGSLLFSGVTFAGYVGILTGWKPNRFGISSNERDKGSLTENILSAIYELSRGGKLYPVTMIARMALEADADFSSAVHRLTSSQLIAPVYYIVSGNSTDQGVVIVRDRFNTLGTNRLNQTDGKWFIVQTNYDPWVQPPEHDNRRDPAIKAMKKIGQDSINMSNMFRVLSTNPVLNDKTAYSSVYSATYWRNSTTVIRGNGSRRMYKLTADRL